MAMFGMLLFIFTQRPPRSIDTKTPGVVADEEQIRILVIFVDDVDRLGGKAGRDRRPGRAEVVGPVEIRLEIVEPVAVLRDVGAPGAGVTRSGGG